MKMKTALLTALAVMAVSASCMAAPGDDFNVVDVHGNHHAFCTEKMASWADRIERGEDLSTIRKEADKIYVRGNNRIAYYDEWVSFDKADKAAFARADIAVLGAPEKLLEKMTAGDGFEEEADE